MALSRRFLFLAIRTGELEKPTGTADSNDSASPLLVHPPAAADVEQLARQPVSLRRCQKHHNFGDILRPADPPQGRGFSNVPLRIPG